MFSNCCSGLRSSVHRWLRPMLYILFRPLNIESGDGARGRVGDIRSSSSSDDIDEERDGLSVHVRKSAESSNEGRDILLTRQNLTMTGKRQATRDRGWEREKEGRWEGWGRRRIWALYRPYRLLHIVCLPPEIPVAANMAIGMAGV